MSTPTIESLFGPHGELSERTPETEGLFALAKTVLRLRQQEADAEAAKKAVSDQLGTAESELMKKLDEVKIKSIKLPSGENLGMIEKHQFSLPPKSDPENRKKAIAWLRRVGARELIEDSIHPQTMTAFLRKRLEEKKPIVEIIKDTTLRYLQVRKS